MKRSAPLAGAALLAAGLVLATPVGPAAAAVVTSVSGTSLTVTVTGEDTAAFSCVSGKVRVNNVVTSPAVACTALTNVTITGDGGNQTIHADQLTASSFPAFTGATITTNGGNDAVFASPKVDAITTGTGTDAVVVDIRGKAASAISLGGDADDTLYLEGSAADDQISISSSGSNGNVTTKVGSAPDVGRPYSLATRFVLHGNDGNDTLSTKSLFVPYPVTIDGGDGDDTLESGYGTCDLFGRTGTNTYKGGQCVDYVHSVSDTDIINGGASTNTFYDETSLHSGGRTIAEAPGASDTYEVDLARNDAVWRTRRGTPKGTSDLTASLNRNGQQHLASTVDQVTATFAGASQPADHTLADVEPLYSMDVTIKDGTKTTVVDITIPAGTWTTTGTIGNGSGTVTPSDSNFSPVNLANVGPVQVHGPWTNKNRGWGHRMIRDLLFRFGTSTELNDIQGDLAGGTITRPMITANTMDTDEYRGLDVDRTFVKYLRRAADPGGRTYWINSIANGKALWRFRAQLFGSNEYFSKAGGTNALYVEKAYSDVLGRSPDPSGKAYWTNKLNNGADRGSVALQFINSPEARRRLVDDQFLRFLDRKPNSAEQTTWVDALPGATGEQDLIAYLVNSGAYYART